jgi:hypothetical protein
MTQQAGNKRSPFLFFVLLFITLLLAQGLVGCGSASQAQASSVDKTPTAATHQASPTSGSPVASTPTATPTQGSSTQTTPTPQATVAAPVLHGATNFLLNAPFAFSSANGATTDDSGASTPLDAATVKTEVTQELKHLLFVVDDSDNIKVYSQGEKPVSVQVAYNPDGSATLNYTQTADSEAGSISILFSALLSAKKIEVSYEQQYTPSLMINAQASLIEVDFTAQVKWVAPDDIPAAPGNGAYQLTSQGGVALSWSAGQNAVAYDVYRLVADQNQQFQLLATIKGTTYSDNSSETIQNIHATKGITYAIFSVGPTGVENPGGIIISL